MKVYARFDGEGWPTGFYPEDVFQPIAAVPANDETGEPGQAEQRNPSIPMDAVEITEADWIELRAAPAHTLAYINGQVTPKAKPPGPIDLLAYARAKRWEIENAGITVAGVPVATNDRSKVMIAGGRVAAEADAAWTTVWDGADGESYPIDAAAMIAISAAVQAHVNACFVAYASVKAGLVADPPTITTTAEIDAAFAAIATAY
jgi:hypothetical protein